MNRNHYQILLLKPGAVVSPPPSPPAASNIFTLKIEKDEIYPSRLHFTNTLDSTNPYRTKILLKEASPGIPAPKAWVTIEGRFIPNQIYLKKINNIDYRDKNAEASWTEIVKLFTQGNYIATNDVTMEFIDLGRHIKDAEEGWIIRGPRLKPSYGYTNPADILAHINLMPSAPTGVLNVAAAKASATGKISWIDDAELTGQFKTIDAEYIQLVNETDKIDKKLLLTFAEADKDKELPPALKTFSIYVTANPLGKLRKEVIDLNNTVNALRTTIISKAAENWDKGQAETQVKGYGALKEQYRIKSKEFRDTANAYIEPIEKFYADRYAAKIAAAAAAEEAKVARMSPAELAAYRAAAAIGGPKPPSIKFEGRPKAPVPGERDRIGEQLFELEVQRREKLNAFHSEKNPELKGRLEAELTAIIIRQRELTKEYHNLRGGTRKKRHHSYPLKHTFKNRRA